jgi:branched-chain amino acid transport system permease protein
VTGWAVLTACELHGTTCGIWANQIVQGVLLGGYYAILATGLALLFGVMRIVNLAHGDLAVLGAFALWWLHDREGWSPFLGLALVIPAMALLGWALDRTIFERSLRGGELTPVLATFGLAIVIQNLLFEGWGADVRSLDIGELGYSSWRITDEIYVGRLPVIVLGTAVVLLAVLQLFLSRAPLGRTIRATAQDRDTAELVGINSRAVYATTAAIAVGTVAIAGAFLGTRGSFEPYTGPNQLLFGFEAVVIGGLGSLWGTLLGGVVLGVSQAIGAQLDPQWQLLAGHVVFLAVLGARLMLAALSARGGLRAALGMLS